MRNRSFYFARLGGPRNWQKGAFNFNLILEFLDEKKPNYWPTFFAKKLQSEAKIKMRRNKKKRYFYFSPTHNLVTGSKFLRRQKLNSFGTKLRFVLFASLSIFLAKSNHQKFGHISLTG